MMSLSLVGYSDSESLTDSDTDELVSSIPQRTGTSNVNAGCEIAGEQDFFALHDSEESEAGEPDHHETESIQSHILVNSTALCEKDLKKSTEDAPGRFVPRSKFWSSSQKIDDWMYPQKVWNTVDTGLAQKEKYFCHGSNKHTLDRNTEGYISKRQKMVLEADNATAKSQNTVKMLEQSCFYVHPKIAPVLHHQARSRIPNKKLVDLEGHAGPVNRISWCLAQYSHLLASAGTDNMVKIWNMFSGVSHEVQLFTQHRSAVKDVVWSPCGRQILSCGYDCRACLCDVQKGEQLAAFEHASFVTCVKYHPVDPNTFVTGCRDSVQCWDVRCPEKPVKTFSYKESFGQVQDMLFIAEGNQLVTCSDIVSRDSADKSIMVFDFKTGVVMSNQVYQERYTCTRLCLRPHSSEMMAQTNGNYLALFSTNRPYKMNKCKRFDNHKVLGYKIGCDFSPDGSFVVSGSADGKVTFYDYERGRLLRRLDVDKEVCLDVAWHPVLPSTVASTTWAGHITVWI